jgi:hypothetical protein
MITCRSMSYSRHYRIAHGLLWHLFFPILDSCLREWHCTNHQHMVHRSQRCPQQWTYPKDPLKCVPMIQPIPVPKVPPKSAGVLHLTTTAVTCCSYACISPNKKIENIICTFYYSIQLAEINWQRV